MPGKLRVFISSTMSDLANERDAVVQKLSAFNFEPVNAENWSASGSTPWERIAAEIRSCDLFVLILGDRYGFQPTQGPGAAEKLSATHLEYRTARDIEKMPILVFLKRLDADTTIVDARRDEFREEVRLWKTGHLTVKFELARDLADKVAASIIDTLSNAWTRERVHSRVEDATRGAAAEPPRTKAVSIPPDLREAIGGGRALLIAGAGMSLEVGLPDAMLYNEVLLQRNVEADPNYWRGTASSLERVAEDYELATSRKALIDVVIQMMDITRGGGPARSHLAAVQYFNTIVTSNFDTLFEAAAEAVGTGHRPVNRASELVGPPRIVHVRGCVTDPGSLALTETDLARDWESYWWDLRSELRNSVLLVIGTSLNDPALLGLLRERSRAPGEPGYFVAPGSHQAGLRRTDALNLRHITATASDFFAALAGAKANV